MRRYASLSLLLVLAGLLAGGAARAQGDDAAAEIQRQLAGQTRGGVFDLGGLLKPGGIRELQALAADFERGGLRLWVVTVPRDVPAQVAERVYANQRMTDQDLLVVFNGKQVYGRTDALKGEPQAFTEALQQSQGDFSRYWGKGLATFASLLRARIEQRRGGQSTPAAPPLQQPAAPPMLENHEPPGLTWAAVVLGTVILIGAWIPFRRRQVEGQLKARFEEHVAHARELFTQYGERVVEQGLKEEDTRFVDFSRRLEECEKEKDYYNLGDLARLIAELEEAVKDTPASPA